MVLRIALASTEQRRTIYGLRHEIYAHELGQHAPNAQGEIRDALDDGNVYIAATDGDAIAGFVSITSPRQGRYSIDKYLQRDQIPFAIDDGTYEVRILTVLPAYRRSPVASLLMLAAFRWVEAHGGTRILALGRREIHSLYVQAGLEPMGVNVRSGAVEFVLMTETIDALRRRAERLEPLFARLERTVQWDLIVPFRRPAECFHGGAFFDAVGDEFDRLDRRASIINADVLDAWFPPSPRVLAALDEHLPWLLRTSPPLGAEGLVRTIARARGVDPKCILPGAGSSDLIYLALREWLRRSSRALILEPMYGEYAHVLEKVIGCRVDRLVLSRRDRYDLDASRLRAPGYDLIVVVNPNSPTGRHVPRAELESVLREIPDDTLVWIDETYIDYAGSDASLERFAVGRENVVVCKSMSKVYALSGARCAYLCASPHLLERLRSIAPPWSVSLPAQVAVVAALQDEPYYTARHRETAALRAELMAALPFDVVPGTANFLLCHLGDDMPPAAEVVARCREEGLFIRDASTMGATLGDRAIRIAVKDRETNRRMAGILADGLKPVHLHGLSAIRSPARNVYVSPGAPALRRKTSS
jgi:histidinol-phosphate/aromatic aminotransferase/cobyric acid decarboxylase-like protein/GNAT superfamily N-acetyltransferase